MASLSEVYRRIIDDGKITLIELKEYISAGGNVYELMSRHWGMFTGAAKNFVNSKSTGVVDVWNALPESLKKLAMLGSAAGVILQLGKQIEEAGGIIAWIESLLFRVVILPIARALFDAISAFLDTLTVIFYGTNRQIGLGGELGSQTESIPGLLDVPFLLSRPIAGLNIDIYGSFVSFIEDGIETVSVPIAEQAGIAAPAVTSAFWALIIFGGAWALWTVARSVDVPFINPTGAFLAVTKPIRNIINRWL